MKREYENAPPMTVAAIDFATTVSSDGRYIVARSLDGTIIGVEELRDEAATAEMRYRRLLQTGRTHTLDEL